MLLRESDWYAEQPDGEDSALAQRVRELAATDDDFEVNNLVIAIYDLADVERAWLDPGMPTWISYSPPRALCAYMSESASRSNSASKSALEPEAEPTEALSATGPPRPRNPRSTRPEPADQLADRRRIGSDHHELIAADAVDRVRFCHSRFDALGDLHQHGVAAGVATFVVDPLGTRPSR